MATYKVPKVAKVSQTYNTNPTTNEYSLGFFEYLARYGKLICIPYDFVGFPQGSGEFDYTVPNGFTFFITNIQTSGWINNNGAGANFGASRVFIDNQTIYYHDMFVWAINNGQTFIIHPSTMSENYNIPLRAESGQKIKLLYCTNDGIFVKGFLIENSKLLY